LTNISGSSNNVTFTLTNANGKYFVFADSYQRVSGGGKSCQVNITALYSPTADESAEILLDWYNTNPSGTRTFQCDYADASGNHRLYGEFAIDSANSGMAAGQGGPSQVQATLASHGEFSIEPTTT
jgi:hypothetical protein